MDFSYKRIIFHTNSLMYLDRLIPKRYREKDEPEKPKWTLTLQDRSHVAFEIKSDNLNVAIHIDVLERISQIWLIILPTLPGAPELLINLSLVPIAIKPAIENIIRSVGHISYSQLGGLYDRNDIFDGPILAKNSKALIENYLRPQTSTSKIIECLHKIRNEVDDADKGPWLPVERVNIAIKFLKCLKGWETTKAYFIHIEKKFERAAVLKNTEQFSETLKWFQEKQREQREQEKQQREQEKQQRELTCRRSSRLKKRNR